LHVTGVTELYLLHETVLLDQHEIENKQYYCDTATNKVEYCYCNGRLSVY